MTPDAQHQAVVAATDPSIKEYALISGSAFLGTFLRYQRWQDERGRIAWWRIALEVPGSFAFGVIALGLSLLIWKTQVSPWTVAALAGFMGMVGPGAVSGLVARYIGVPSDGGPKNNQ